MSAAAGIDSTGLIAGDADGLDLQARVLGLGVGSVAAGR
jgi:hypothetical protein